jgi:rod shape-determining protein MreC
VFTSLSRRRIIMLVVLSGLLLITLDKRGAGVLDRVRGVFATALSPFDTAARAVVLPVERAWNGVANYGDVIQENKALRDIIEHQKGADVEARSAVLQYRELLKTIQLASKFQYPTVAAQVVGTSPSNFQNIVEINVGSLKGVRVGMPVTDGAGLIGRITRVYPTRSIVLLVSDPDFAIGAQVLSAGDQSVVERPTYNTTPSGLAPNVSIPVATGDSVPASTPNSSIPTSTGATTTVPLANVVRETGTLQGQGIDRPLVLRFVDASSSLTKVKVGSVVDTAGGNDGLAPQGLPIGVITAIHSQPGSSSMLIEVTPVASLQRLNFVVVVRYVENPTSVGP